MTYDSNLNGIPDAQEGMGHPYGAYGADANMNGIHDAYESAYGPYGYPPLENSDVNDNDIHDYYEYPYGYGDTNNDGTLDSLDIYPKGGVFGGYGGYGLGYPPVTNTDVNDNDINDYFEHPYGYGDTNGDGTLDYNDVLPNYDWNGDGVNDLN
jgi:hypothetical protein